MQQKDLIVIPKELKQFLGKKLSSSKGSLEKTNHNAGSISDNTSIASHKDLQLGQMEKNTFDLSAASQESPFEQSLFRTQNQQDNMQFNIEDNNLQSFWNIPFRIEEDDNCQLINFPFISKEYENCQNCLEENNQGCSFSLSLSNKTEFPEKTFPMASKQQTKFLIIQKGKKKVTKPKKINKNIPPQFKCNHCNCGIASYTLYQQITHHHKMTPLCTNDSIKLLKLLSKTKKLFFNLKDYKKQNPSVLRNIKEKYASIRKKVSLENHFQYILGSCFEECVTDDDDEEEDINEYNNKATTE